MLAITVQEKENLDCRRALDKNSEFFASCTTLCALREIDVGEYNRFLRVNSNIDKHRGPTGAFEEYSESRVDAVAEFLKARLPCGYVFKSFSESECVNFDNGHAKDHQTADGTVESGTYDRSSIEELKNTFK